MCVCVFEVRSSCLDTPGKCEHRRSDECSSRKNVSNTLNRNGPVLSPQTSSRRVDRSVINTRYVLRNAVRFAVQLLIAIVALHNVSENTSIHM